MAEWLSSPCARASALRAAQPPVVALPSGAAATATEPPLFIRPRTTDRMVRETADKEFPALAAALVGAAAAPAGGWTVLDAGANAGYASRHFAALLPGARVVAVEAEYGNYGALRANTASYPQVIALHAALWGQREQTLRLVDGNRQPEKIGREWQFMVSSEHSAAAAANRTHGGGRTDRRQPRSVTVSSLLEGLCLPRFDLIKLDCEGCEASIFDDAAELGWLGSFQYMYWEGACVPARPPDTAARGARCNRPRARTARSARGYGARLGTADDRCAAATRDHGRCPGASRFHLLCVWPGCRTGGVRWRVPPVAAQLHGVAAAVLPCWRAPVQRTAARSSASVRRARPDLTRLRAAASDA
eukprot:1227087-Prymnesium_polylepis.1